SSPSPHPERWALVGAHDALALTAPGVHVERHADLAALLAALDHGASLPDVIVVPCLGAERASGLASDLTVTHEYSSGTSTDQIAAAPAARSSGTPPARIATGKAARASGRSSDLIDATHAETARVLALLQGWLTHERLASSRLVVLTRRAIATRPDEDVID